MLELMNSREEKFYRDLGWRTKRSLRVLHVLHEADVYSCLDLSANAPTLDALKTAIKEKLVSLAPDAVLPAAPRVEWEKIAGLLHSTIPHERWLMPHAIGTRPMLWLTVVEK